MKVIKVNIELNEEECIELLKYAEDRKTQLEIGMVLEDASDSVINKTIANLKEQMANIGQEEDKI